MIHNNHSSQPENMPPISKAELNELTTALEQASVKIDVVNQPFTVVLKKLESEQKALAQEVIKSGTIIVQQQKTIDRQSQEIAALRKQISQDSSWGIASVNWPTVIAITLFSSTVVVGSWFLIQRFVPIQLDPNTAQKIDTLYNQYLNQRQTKTSGAKKR
jgi:hypothetical protein